jgi:xanthine dehydrogenase YagR molybdenum-binding subunit
MTAPLIGGEVSRVDGRAKTTGSARYAADHREPEMAHAVVVQATIGLGRVTAMHTDRAVDSAGVLAVYSPFNPLRLYPDPSGRGENYQPLQDQNVRFRGQTIGVVVADSFEHARDAAALITVDYEQRPPRVSLTEAGPGATVSGDEPGRRTVLAPGVASIEAALRAGDVVVETTVSQPSQSHAAMEPHASVAVWRAGSLTLYTGSQRPSSTAASVAGRLGIRPDQVRVVSTYVGGGFGSKAMTWSDVVLAAAAARALNRPVKLVLARAQVFTIVGHRSTVRQTVRLAAGNDGVLTAVSHESDAEAPAVGGWPMQPAADTTAMLYRTPNLHIDQRLVTMDVPPTWAMRAPHEAPGAFAIETAMDELAVATAVDPVELRLRNYTTTVPGEERIWTSKRLDECYRVGAARFGWAQRPTTPGSRRDGQWLVGMGMASAIYPAGRAANEVRIRFCDDGTIEAATATSDIGTGAATALAIVVADAVGLPLDRIVARVGDTSLPPGAGAVGSRVTGSMTPVARAAAHAAIRKLIDTAATHPRSPFATASAPVSYRAGSLSAGATVVGFADLLHTLGLPGVEASDTGDDAVPDQRRFVAHGFGAHFCEVRVNSFTGETRISRFTTVVDVGRVINAKAARSQVVGGVIFGIGHALLEANPIEASGRMACANLGDYLVPVNADVPFIDAVCLDGDDTNFSDVGARGIGELGTVGSAAAVGNAVYNATGIRIRDLPIHPEDLLRESEA